MNYKGNNVSPILSGLITSLQVKPWFWSEWSLKQSCHLICGLNHVNQVILEQDKQSKENAFYYNMPSILFFFLMLFRSTVLVPFAVSHTSQIPL